MLTLFLIGCLFAQYGLNAIIASDSYIDMVYGYIYIGAFALSLILLIILLYTRIKYRKSINFDELKGSIDSKNYFFVAHPYKNRKFSFKNIMEILKIIKDFRK